MCGPMETISRSREGEASHAEPMTLRSGHRLPRGVPAAGAPASTTKQAVEDSKPPPIDVVEPPPSLLARYTCASLVVAIFAVWGKYTFVDESDFPSGPNQPMHSWKVPALLTSLYLVSLPLLRRFSNHFLVAAKVDVKLLLKESMIVYNAGQVLLNGWMVYRFIDALAFRGHPLIGGSKNLVDTGATFAVWVHYCDKYLEFLDTFFMVLRGRMDQVSFLHVYHHTSISWAWWCGLSFHPGGDSYFGALFNSWIHVMMYSYYTLSLLKISCPWKRYLTQAQLLQFTTVLAHSIWSKSYMVAAGASWSDYIAHSIQDFEMTSLFVLFMSFYRRTYSKKKKSRGKKQDESTRSQSRKDESSEDSAPIVAESDASSDLSTEGSSDEERD